MKYFIIIGLLLSTTFWFSCTNPQKSIAGNYSYETECLGVEMDGSQTVKAWGSGRNRLDAIEQAKKNAVNDVLFKGIRNGKSECNVKPVLIAVNVRENNEDFFNSFFTDEGQYADYITGEDGSKLHIEIIKNRKQAGSQETYGVIVRVQRAKLKQLMIDEKIIK